MKRMMMREMLNKKGGVKEDRGGGIGWCCTHPHPGYALQ